MPIFNKGKAWACLLDDEDYEIYSKWKWQLTNYGYARRTTRGGQGKVIVYNLHRIIMNAKKGQQVEHRDNNPLNNQRSNLRFSTQAQNMHNRKVGSNNTSGYKGVSKYSYKGLIKWRAMISYGGKTRSLGLFETPVEAAKAYNRAALELDPEFAHINKLYG